MASNPTFPSKLSERKAIEKNRRDQMKALYCNLCSLIPRQSSQEVVSLSDQIGEAANYIKELQERLEVMKKKKKSLKVRKSADLMSSDVSSDSETRGLKLPRIEIHSNGSTLDVVLITGLQHRYLFKETVGILHEEVSSGATTPSRQTVRVSISWPEDPSHHAQPKLTLIREKGSINIHLGTQLIRSDPSNNTISRQSPLFKVQFFRRYYLLNYRYRPFQITNALDTLQMDEQTTATSPGFIFPM
ncbi:hypothetical protein C2S51_015190 [Perilla frutescens var. frutescens]|nr:hypothetical protein C2S51_015190 [Perilla frutescens var. frutescens]